MLNLDTLGEQLQPKVNIICLNADPSGGREEGMVSATLRW